MGPASPSMLKSRMDNQPKGLVTATETGGSAKVLGR